jgi:hypothetical protein
MTLEPEILDQSEIDRVNAEASVLMKRGIGLMSDGEPATIGEALECFDRALEMRRRLPYRQVPMLGYGLAACLLNRADALAQLGSPDQLLAALASYDEGIIVLRDLPLSEDPRFPRRLAMAHQNRGLALQARGGVEALGAAMAFAGAIEVLEADYSALIPDRHYLLAVVWTNLANAHASVPAMASGSAPRDAALQAIALVAGAEEGNAHFAEVGLKARHVLCRTIARRLSVPASGDEGMPEDVHEATDAVDDGLALVRAWEHKGVTAFRGVAHDLFRFGARVYARYQPQFLEEFVQDNLDPSSSSVDYVESVEMRSAAEEVRGLTRPADPSAGE